MLPTLTIGEALKLLRVLSDIVQLFKLQPIVYQSSYDSNTSNSLDSSLSPSFSIRHSPSHILTPVTLNQATNCVKQRTVSLQASMFDSAPAYRGFGDFCMASPCSTNRVVPSASLASSLSILMDGSTAGAKPSFAVFKTALGLDCIRRALLVSVCLCGAAGGCQCCCTICLSVL